MTAATSFNDAVSLHRAGRLGDAEQVYGGILRENPNHAGVLHLLGVIREQQGRHEEALELIGRALAINPGKAIYHNNHGATLISLDRTAEAEASFRNAIAIRPDYADAHANLGLAQAALSNDAAAESSYRRALEIHAWHTDAVVRLAALLERQNRRENAAQLLESARAAAPCPQFEFALKKLHSVGEWYVSMPGLPSLTPNPQSPCRASATWAMLIKRVYETDPMACPKCGGEMKVVSFIEPPQSEVIEKIMRHCGLWDPHTPRPPPAVATAAEASDADSPSDSAAADESPEWTYVDMDTFWATF